VLRRASPLFSCVLLKRRFCPDRVLRRQTPLFIRSLITFTMYDFLITSLFFRNTTHRTRAPCVSTVADAFCTCVDRCLMRSAHFLRFSDVPSTVFLQSSYRQLRHKNSLTHAASDASSSEETLNSNRGSLSCFSLHLYSSGYFGQRPCWRRIADSSSRGASSKLEFFVPTRLSRPVAIATWDPEV